MYKLSNWNIIENDLRIGLVLIAENARYLVGMGKRGDIAASAILGMSEVTDCHMGDRIGDPEFIGKVDIANTHLAMCAKRCFDLVTVLGPIDEIDVEDEEAEGTQWLSYFLSSMPQEAMGGLDYTGKFHNPDAPVVRLLGMAAARLELASFIQNLVLRGVKGSGFTPKEIAYLGDVDVRSVRNVMGPKGDKAIRSNVKPKQKGEENELVLGDALNALEWLAGRRGFHSGRLSPEWVSQQLPKVSSREVAAVIPAITGWVNRTTTEQLASSLDWPVEKLRAWNSAETVDRSSAAKIAELVGIDPQSYQRLIDLIFG
jgi:hypothetical protein